MGALTGRRRLLNAPNDDEAREKALQMVDGHDIELWDEDRLLGRFSREGRVTKQT